MRVLIRSLIDFVLPPRCPLCSAQVDSPDSPSLCASCFSEVTFITPPYCLKCGTPFASQTEESHLCGQCMAGTNAYDMARAIYAFSGSAREAIHAFKYRKKTYLAKILIGLMEGRPPPLRISQYDKLVPVPLHRNRLSQRGYNQSVLLAREMGRRHGVPVDEGALKRTRDSIPQVELTGAERQKNVKGVFSLEGDVVEKKILLVDDVFTTGATVNECAKVLRKGGARRIDVFTLARTV